MRPTLARWAAMIGAVAAACSSAPREAGPAFVIEALPSPAGPDSGAPQLTVGAGRPILSWVEPDGAANALRFAVRTDDGWSAPQQIISDSHLLMNAADVPSVRRLHNNVLAANWPSRQLRGSAGYDVAVTWSTDKGHTWAAPVTPHHDGTDTEHGFASLFTPPDGGIGIVWLDGRETMAHHAGASSGATALRASTFTLDGAQSDDVVVDERTCDCCPTAIAETPDGIVVAYRDRSAEDVRDISVSRLSGGRWSPPSTVHDDGWSVAACPVNGPSISARGRDVVVAWFTGKQGDGRGFVAFSHDEGRTFGAPIAIDEQAPVGRTQAVLLADGSAAVGWISYAGSASALRLRRIEGSGIRSPAVSVATRMGTQHPRLALDGDVVVLAWTDSSGGQSQVRTARATLGGPSALLRAGERH